MEEEQDPLSRAIDPIFLTKEYTKLLGVEELANLWATVKKPFVQDDYRRRNQVLRERNKSMRKMVSTINSAISPTLDNLLKQDEKIYKICKGKRPNEIKAIVENMVFVKRKRIDRLNFELKKLKDELQEIKAAAAEVRSRRIVGQEKALKLYQDREAELENIKTEKDAGIIALNSYKKLMDIMKKESHQFDGIFNRLKAIVVLRADFALHLFDVIKWATFDVKALEEAEKMMSYVQMALAYKQSNELKQLQIDLNRTQDIKVGGEETVVSAEEAALQEQQLEQYSVRLKDIKDQWENAFKRIRYACRVTKDTEVLSSIENALKNQNYLLHLIELNYVLLDNHSKRKDYLQHTLDKSRYTMPEYVYDYRTDKNELVKEKTELEKKLRELEDKAKYLPQQTELRYQVMYSIKNLLKDVCLQPYDTFKITQDAYRRMHVDRKKEDEDLEKAYGLLEDKSTIEDSVDKHCAEQLALEVQFYDDDHFLIEKKIREYAVAEETKVPLIFDGIFLKVKLMLRQLGDDPDILYKAPTEKEMAEYMNYVYQTKDMEEEVVDEDQLVEVVDEEKEMEKAIAKAKVR